MRTGGGLAKPMKGDIISETARILSTISQELEPDPCTWDSDAPLCMINSDTIAAHITEEMIPTTAGIVEEGSECVAPSLPPINKPGKTAPQAGDTPYIRRRKHARATLTPHEAAVQEFMDVRRKEHQLNMKIKEKELLIKDADLILKAKEKELKDENLILMRMELKIKEKEFKIKEKYLENLELT